MRYSQATYVVTFEHDDSVPAELAALHIATTQIYRGSVISVKLDTDEIQPLDAAGVIEAMGGCGECAACRANREDLAVHAVMEGSVLATAMGWADSGAIAAERAAMQRAHERTV